MRSIKALELLNNGKEVEIDGKPAMTYHPDGEKMPLTIQNDIDMNIIMPVFMHNGEPDEDHIIIEVK